MSSKPHKNDNGSKPPKWFVTGWADQMSKMARQCPRAAVLACVALSLARPAHADGEGARTRIPHGAPKRATVTALMSLSEDLHREETLQYIAIRRALSNPESPFRFIHPADLGALPMPAEVSRALEDLDSIAARVRMGPHTGLLEELDARVRTLRSSILFISRAQLADAMTLRALCKCQMGKASDCRDDMTTVLTFRPQMAYDLERYPRQYSQLFDSVRRELSHFKTRGSVLIASVPNGAEAFLDGHSLGTTPARAEGLVPGLHFITVLAAGYRRAALPVLVRTDYQVQKTILLEQNRAHPRWNGQPVARATAAPNRLHLGADLGRVRAPRTMERLRPWARTDLVLIAEERTGPLVGVLWWLYDVGSAQRLGAVAVPRRVAHPGPFHTLFHHD